MSRNFNMGLAVLGSISIFAVVTGLHIVTAKDRVVVNDHTFICQTSCVVIAGSNGGVTVRDSEFGWISMIVKVPGSPEAS